jgi:D-glycero-D-manno-heptose 1,7-bisphosphate phosphatase
MAPPEAGAGARRAVFLDRDGVIIEDRGFAHRAEDCHLLPGAVAGLARLAAAGFLLIVTTNQSGIGRGYYGEADYQAFTAHLVALLAREGITLTGVLHCPHAPDAGCDCRKPLPGMLLEARARWDIDLGASYMVGDRGSDLEAAAAAGLADWVLVGARPGALDGARVAPGHVASDLEAAAEWLVAVRAPRPVAG